jgi:hypothetical protein
MCKLLVAAVLLVILALWTAPGWAQPAPAPSPGNLILNGSFEHNVDNDAFPDHWWLINYAPGGDIRWVEGDAFDGHVGVHMSVPKDGQVILRADGGYNSALPCQEGQSYVLSIYARTEGPVQASVVATGIFADGHYGYQIGGGMLTTTGPTGWTRYTWTFTGPAGIRTMAPYISFLSGTATVDCFQLEAGTQASAYAPPHFARLYVEPRDGRASYLATAFAPQYTIYNETAAPIRSTLQVSLAEVWGPRHWALHPLEVSLAPGASTEVQVTGVPPDLPPERYRLTFTGSDQDHALCCGMPVDQTLTPPPNGPIPRFPLPEPPIIGALPSVADGYSRLLVTQAGRDDTLRQLNRALYYAGRAGLKDPDPAATAAVLQAETDAQATLDTARHTYNDAYSLSFALHAQPKPLTDDQRRQRDQALTAAAQSLTALEADAPQLQAQLDQRLAALTTAIAGKILPGFQPQVVGHPGRPQQELTLDFTGHANGIIWGLEGRSDHVLRLQRWFDFGTSGLEATPGMRGPSQLSAGAQTWFNSDDYLNFQRAGLKAEANFYCSGGSLTNAAALPYFLDAHPNDSDIFMQTSSGAIPNKQALNIWNPLVRAQVRDYCTTQARLLRQDPRTFYNYYAWEPTFELPGSVALGGVETGYNPTAQADFRHYLQAEFGTIEKLNAAWGSTYASFAAIEPPPDGMLVPRPHATPLTYEFERWREKSYADYYKLCYDAIKAGDPDHPCGISGEGAADIFNSYCYTNGIDYWQMAKEGMDFIEAHGELYTGLPGVIWEHSMARVLHKPQLLNESNWDWSAPSHNQNERQWQATGEISTWCWMVWGRTYIDIMSAESEYVPTTQFYGQSLLEMNQDYTALRESAKFVKIAMDKSNRYSDLLLSTEIATPKVVILQPSTSIIDCYPSGGPLNGWPQHPPLREAFHFAALLEPHNYDYLFLPEEAILQDHHDLSQYKAVLLPYATHFPPGLEEQLLAYVRSGGWLICSGPPDVFDPYGRPDNRLLTTLLGACAPAYVSGDEDHWVWALHPKQLRPEVHVDLSDDAGAPLVLTAPYGQGGIVLSLASWRTDAALQICRRALDSAIGHRTAWCDADKLELVTRADARGRRYLFVMNRSVDDTSEDLVHVEGAFPHPLDLGVGQRFPVPAQVEQGFTSFSLRLERGDATVIALQ